MVTARGFAVKNGYDLDPDQEFIALGVANIGAGLLKGFAISGADSRTAINDSVGGKTQVTGLVAAAVLILVLVVPDRPTRAAANPCAGRRADHGRTEPVRHSRAAGPAAHPSQRVPPLARRHARSHHRRRAAGRHHCRCARDHPAPRTRIPSPRRDPRTHPRRGRLPGHREPRRGRDACRAW